MTEPVTVTEWGVRYAYDGSTHVDNHGTSEALARSACDTYAVITTQPLQAVTLVTRQVAYSEWEEVTEVSEPDEAGAVAAEQDAAAEASQDDEQPAEAEQPQEAHEASPF